MSKIDLLGIYKITCNYEVTMNAIELVAPAGSPEALDAAIGAGADAVYLGVKNFNARLRTTNFAYSQAQAAIRTLRRMGKRCYITVNTVFEQRESNRMYQLLNYLSRIEPDGLIVQDFGVAYMARRYFPSLKLHASTQMNIASGRGVNILSKRGISRVVLARELALEEIRDIRSKTNSELEVFVHGALCISESGLCLFSSFLGGKSANRGMCTQACRRMYRTAGRVSEEGYFFSPGDLQMIEKVPLLADAGVNAFKIEGRMKSADYAGVVVSAYRMAIDSLGGSEEQISESIERAKRILQNDFAREKTLFHYDSHTDISFLNPRKSGGAGIALGKILKVRKKGEDCQGLIAYENTPVAEGDSIRIHSSDDRRRLSYKLTTVETSGSEAWISIPLAFTVGDDVFLIQTKAMSKRLRRQSIIPKNIDMFKRAPGHEEAPYVELAGRGKAVNGGAAGGTKKPKSLPEGLYAAVSRTSDLYAAQSIKPVKVILTLNTRTLDYLLNMFDKRKQPLPFRAGDLILAFDPFFPQALESSFAEAMPRLCQEGYRTFEINNPAHVSLFRNSAAKVGAESTVELIAGPYLYAFNRFAAAFIQELGVDYIVSPLENNRQNLERTFERQERSSVFVPVFAYPALFRIRSDLSPLYPWERFGDNQDEWFSLITERDEAGAGESLVIPETPFSIVDKIPFLREAGFRRFILDFSGPALKKKEYKTVMAAAQEGVPLPNASRFNWKDGFFYDDGK
ncbi:MAG: U32 family peptidase [Treponema sp.]|jgi:putative protease|nr:U32 family peptidase [Treponema sp.]